MSGDASIGAVAALGDPQRRRLYSAVRAARRPMTREEAALAVGISRKLAAFHLDKLVASGLLEVATGPMPERRGVGRTPKRYQPVDVAVQVSVPPRAYEHLATVLVEAATQESDDETPTQTRERVATCTGRRRGAALVDRGREADGAPEGQLGSVESILAEEGFEPYRSATDVVRLANCPFSPLESRAPELVCGLNLHYVRGLIEGLSADSVSAVLEPRPGECCVEIRPAS